MTWFVVYMSHSNTDTNCWEVFFSFFFFCRTCFKFDPITPYEDPKMLVPQSFSNMAMNGRILSQNSVSRKGLHQWFRIANLVVFEHNFFSALQQTVDNRIWSALSCRALYITQNIADYLVSKLQLPGLIAAITYNVSGTSLSTPLYPVRRIGRAWLFLLNESWYALKSTWVRHYFSSDSCHFWASNPASSRWKLSALVCSTPILPRLWPLSCRPCKPPCKNWMVLSTPSFWIFPSRYYTRNTPAPSSTTMLTLYWLNGTTKTFHHV